jgi:hypothetical protein
MRNGKISEVDAQLPPDNAVVINCGGLLLMPGKCAYCRIQQTFRGWPMSATQSNTQDSKCSRFLLLPDTHMLAGAHSGDSRTETC